MDDDILQILIIKKICSKIQDVEIVGEFESAIDAKDFIKHNEVDLVFLDIELPEYSGVEFVSEVKTVNIIVISSHEKYAFELFSKKSVLGYLKKPISQNDLSKALDLVRYRERVDLPICLRARQTFLNHVFVNINKQFVKINLLETCIIESKGDYLLIKSLGKKNIVFKGTLNGIMYKLPINFGRVHKSFIVNLNRIDEMSKTYIKINNSIVPVGRKYQKEMLTKLTLL